MAASDVDQTPAEPYNRDNPVQAHALGRRLIGRMGLVASVSGVFSG
jgi:hypothetical protein